MDTARTSTRPKLPRMQAPGYVPKEGETITLDLPDERTRATIKRVISDTALIAELQHYTTSKSHPYRKGDLVAAKFGPLAMNQVGWRAVSERELADSEPAKKAAPKSRKRKKKGA